MALSVRIIMAINDRNAIEIDNTSITPIVTRKTSGSCPGYMLTT